MYFEGCPIKSSHNCSQCQWNFEYTSFAICKSIACIRGILFKYYTSIMRYIFKNELRNLDIAAS